MQTACLRRVLFSRRREAGARAISTGWLENPFISDRGRRRPEAGNTSSRTFSRNDQLEFRGSFERSPCANFPLQLSFRRDNATIPIAGYHLRPFGPLSTIGAMLFEHSRRWQLDRESVGLASLFFLLFSLIFIPVLRFYVV